MAVHDPEDAPWWYIFGKHKADRFVNYVAPNIGLTGIKLNPEKLANYSAPDLIDGNLLAELKTQETPYFKAKRDYGIAPQYAVSFNRGDYELYESEYPDLRIYFWINWQELEKFDITVKPMFGVYRVNFPQIVEQVESGRARLHEYKNRRGDQINETHSYGLDVRTFERIIEFDPRKQGK